MEEEDAVVGEVWGGNKVLLPSRVSSDEEEEKCRPICVGTLIGDWTVGDCVDADS